MSKDDRDEKGQFKEGHTNNEIWGEAEIFELGEEMIQYMLDSLDEDGNVKKFERPTFDGFFAMKTAKFYQKGDLEKRRKYYKRGGKIKGKVTKSTYYELKKKSPYLQEIHEECKMIQKMILTHGALKGELKETLTIFYLKHQHGMTDKSLEGGEDDIPEKDLSQTDDDLLEKIANLPDAK